MNIFISVISHNHSKLIKTLACLDKLATNMKVVIKSNTPNDDLFTYCTEKKINYIDSNYGLGFGANNNYVFEYCRTNLGMNNTDYFIVLNPDVIIETVNIMTLVNSMVENNIRISAINLFKDNNFTISDDSVRNFPNFLQFISSFVGLGNKTILNKSKIQEPTHVDWAAGSFLCFSAGHYSVLAGFDESYFMYCEDIDICYRSSKIDHPVTFYPSIKAIHLAEHQNRKILSKHFYWHIKSVFRFLLSKN